MTAKFLGALFLLETDPDALVKFLAQPMRFRNQRLCLPVAGGRFSKTLLLGEYLAKFHEHTARGFGVKLCQFTHSLQPSLGQVPLLEIPAHLCQCTKALQITSAEIGDLLPNLAGLVPLLHRAIDTRQFTETSHPVIHAGGQRSGRLEFNSRRAVAGLFEIH